MFFMREIKVEEPLILEPEDWTKEEWKVIEKLFGMAEADRITISNYDFRAYGRRNDDYGTKEMWQDAYCRLTSIAGACMLGDRVCNTETYFLCEKMFKKYVAGVRTEQFYKDIIYFSENVEIHV